MSRTEWMQAQEGNSLSDRTPALNFLLTREFLSAWIFFMTTEDDKDTTHPMFLYFATEAKPVQTLHSWIQNITESENLQCLLGAEVPFVCLLQRRELEPSFSYYAIPTSSVGKYLGRTQKQRATQTHLLQQHVSRPPIHFTATFKLEYTYTDWLTGD